MQPAKKRKLNGNVHKATIKPKNQLEHRKTTKTAASGIKNITNKTASQNAESFLKRSKMFYSKSLLQKFTTSHVLNKSQPTNNGVYNLLNAIFQFAKKPEKIKRIPKHLLHTKNLFKTLLTNFKQLKLRRLLNFHCPLPKWIIGQHLRAKGSRRKVGYQQTARAFTPVRQVCGY